jgi:putative peptidoglycan lipid II flippase
MKKTVFYLMVITIVSKIIGFAREIILSYFYGASIVSDAYLISITIPSTIFGFILVGIIASYIPMHSKIFENAGEEEANKFTNNLINILIVLSTIVIVIAYIFAGKIVGIFASGFEGYAYELTINFTRISLLAIYFTGLVSILSGHLQMKGNYIIPALIGFPLNLFILISILLSKVTNIYILSFGYVIAVASQLALLIPFVIKSGYAHKLTIRFKDESIIKLLKMSLPVILGTSVNQINVLVDRTLASQITVGGISALNYANRLGGFIQGIFVSSIVTVLYPSISKMSAGKNSIALKKSLNNSMVSIMLLVIPATFGFLFFSHEIISLLFGRGAFDDKATQLTSSALFFYSFGMAGIGLREVTSRFFYSMQDTKTPMINAAIGMTLNIILNFILSKYLGIGGLALATSVSATITLVLMLITLRKKVGSLGLKSTFKAFVKIAFASILMGLLAKKLLIFMVGSGFGLNSSLIISIILGALIYMIIILLMRIEEIDVLIQSIRNKFKTGK